MEKAAADATPSTLAGVLKCLPLFSRIGGGAPHTNTLGEIWLLYADHRWTLEDVAYNGWALANAASLSDLDVASQGVDFVQAEVRARADASGTLVRPETLDFSGRTNPWEDVLRAQGAPSSAQMLAGLSGWTPAGGAP